MSMRLSHSDEGLVETHEINVTPFIDVMLVLLIIFMITAPLMTVDIPVNLPVASAEQKPAPTEPVYLSLKADHSLAVGERTIARTDLIAAISAATKGDKASTIFVRADKTLELDHLMGLLNELRNAGYVKFALVGLEQVPGGGTGTS